MRQIVLFGISVGATVALGTAELRDDIAALVLECPFAQFSSGVRAHMRLTGLPLPSLLPLVIRVAKWLADADVDAVDPLALLSRCRYPLMVIHCQHDPFVPPVDARAVESAVLNRAPGAGVGQYWLVPAAQHLQALPADPEAYAHRLEQFLHAAGALG